jgi:hypothetical protein
MRIQGAHLDVDSFVILRDGIFGESDEGIGMATQRHHGLDQDTHGDAIVERHLGSIPALDRSECEHASSGQMHNASDASQCSTKEQQDRRSSRRDV